MSFLYFYFWVSRIDKDKNLFDLTLENQRKGFWIQVLCLSIVYYFEPLIRLLGYLGQDSYGIVLWLEFLIEVQHVLKASM